MVCLATEESLLSIKPDKFQKFKERIAQPPYGYLPLSVRAATKFLLSHIKVLNIQVLSKLKKLEV